jgi:hypothetical protein
MRIRRLSSRAIISSFIDKSECEGRQKYVRKLDKIGVIEHVLEQVLEQVVGRGARNSTSCAA